MGKRTFRSQKSKHFVLRIIDLLIPLDTHVCRMAYRLGLTDRQTFSLGNARRITGALEEIFPGDPCLGDFALFGYGVSHPDKDEPASDQNFREA